MEELQRLAKDVRKEASRISVRKLARLDCGDRILMRKRLQVLLQELYYIQNVCDSGCSIVIEALESYK